MTTQPNPQTQTRATTMQAMVRTEYGPPEVMHLATMPKPTPRDHEVLIRVHATTVTSGDCRMRSLNVPRGFGPIIRLVMGINKPRMTVLGTEFAGVIEEVGKDVTGFKVGDRVFGMAGMKMGAHAEYLCISEKGTMALTPANLSHQQAASLPFGGTTMLDFYRRGGLKAGNRVLVNGASGAVGVAAIQIARHLGAEVTAVCSARNAELVRSLGASKVIDYTREDFAKGTETYDIIVDAVGNAPFERSQKVLRSGGRLLLVLATLPQMLASLGQSLSGKKVVAGPITEKAEDVQLLARWAQEGHLKPVVDREYTFTQMPEAHRYVDTGRKRGSVVVTVQVP